MKPIYIISLTMLLNSIAIASDSELTGEYTNIQFGRELINRDSFPTVSEFEEYAERDDISLALMFRLVESEDNVVNPNWSSDGKRLSFQKVDTKRNTSKIFVYDHLGMKEPTLLSNQRRAYDYMFRWGVGSPSAFIFARLGTEGGNVKFLGNFNTGEILGSDSPAPSMARDLGLSGNLYANPSIYVRTDQIARIAFDQAGKVLRVASRIPGKTTSAREVIAGQTPRWNRDGRHLLTIERDSTGGTTSRMAVADISDNDVEYFGTKSDHARSPSWSPDERFVSCYVKEESGSVKWSIQVVPMNSAEALSVTMIDDDVIVNADFTTLGPCWNPDASQLWYFSKQHRDAAYYPLVIRNIDSGDTAVVDYPKVCTSPNDMTMNPTSNVPEIVFVGHRDIAQDVFILLLNHF
jgi:dipeptidyl aminopeptidase/acylaminoacyl peptidase